MEQQIKDFLVIKYSSDPGPRYHNQGDDSGEDFYHNVLNELFYEVMTNGQILRINLDGASGYASSFLDEAFGNLVYDFTLDEVQKRLEIISNEEPEWIIMISTRTYHEWEKRRKDNEKPKKTTSHRAWYKLENGEVKKSIWIQEN